MLLLFFSFVSGGIYKETDVGKWVHLVCALYIPGVAFGEVDKLSNITLSELPFSKWGSKVCQHCQDSRFSRTGVCLQCDAGMCRAYFHVTWWVINFRISLMFTEHPAPKMYLQLHSETFSARRMPLLCYAFYDHSKKSVTLIVSPWVHNSTEIRGIFVKTLVSWIVAQTFLE